MVRLPEERMNFKLHNGNCLDILKTFPDNSIDSCITDPPYGLAFMGKKWDYDVPSVDIWKEVFRVLKPGGHLLSFGGSRTYHRMVVNVEDAGFEIRDQIMWLYGSGFPKSHDVSKGIDKMKGADREVVGQRKHPTLDSSKIEEQANAAHGENLWGREWPLTKPATDEAKQWKGWGTALKPAHEPIVLARKPFPKSVAENVLAHGTGALNIDGCRVGTTKDVPASISTTPNKLYGKGLGGTTQHTDQTGHNPNVGRWPADVIHDGSDEVVDNFPDTDKINQRKEQFTNTPARSWKNTSTKGINRIDHPDNGGSAARFFYCAKTSKKDRDEGLEAFEESKWVQWQTQNGTSGEPSSLSEGRNTAYRNIHPTVKPTDLMRYLCRLITPPNGTVLDPFMGSGSTGKAAGLEGFKFIGIELDKSYIQIAETRVQWGYDHAKKQSSLMECF
jgi:DNA modification methylase